MTPQMNSSLKATLLGATMLCVVSPASASFLNDTINYSVTATGNANLNPGAFMGNFIADPDADAFKGLGGNGEAAFLGMSAGSSTVMFRLNGPTNNNNNNGYSLGEIMVELTDIDWLPDAGEIFNVEEIGGFGNLVSSNHTINWTADSVTLAYQQSVFVTQDEATQITLRIDARHNIPEPGSLVGLLTGLAGLGALHRRRRKRS